MGPQYLWVGLDPSPDLQPCMECSSIFFHRGRSQRPVLPTLALCHELLGGKGNEGPQLEQIPTSFYQVCCMVPTSLGLH